MNRRDAIKNTVGIVAATVTAPVHAQESTMLSHGYIQAVPDKIPPEERKKQYAICKVRGHAAAEIFEVEAIYHGPDYVEPSTCRYCGTVYRFVTTMEESNTP
jgi:hypothetical protein